MEAELNACITARGMPVEPPEPPTNEDTKTRLDCAAQAGADLPYDEPDEIRRMTEGSYAFVACMRADGWEIDDPVKSDVGEFMKPPSLFPPVDPNRAAAFDESRDSCWKSAYEEEAPSVVGEGEELDGDEGGGSPAATELSEP